MNDTTWQCPVRCPSCGARPSYTKDEWQDVDQRDETVIECAACHKPYRIRPVRRYVVDKAGRGMR
ncbi:hypothetical protein ACOI8V_07670 [Bifidobacterium hominis]|uniref:hypothetical protein n=1 Tax=Bifidobacterium hominis TaxID=3133177 RepID=UPI003D00E8B3